MLKNTSTQYGILSISFHWISVLMVLGLFGVGLWMVDLGLYDAWYKKAPMLHKSVGVVLFVITVLRFIWVKLNPQPLPPEHSPTWERWAAHLTHILLYFLLFASMISGYLISTGDGRGIIIFNLLELPALPWQFPQQEDIAGQLHEIFTYSLIGLALLHMLAALKHHLIDKDTVLRRMLGRSV